MKKPEKLLTSQLPPTVIVAVSRKGIMLHASCMSGSKLLNGCTNPHSPIALPLPLPLHSPACKPPGNPHRWAEKCIVRCRRARKLHTWQSVTSIPDRAKSQEREIVILTYLISSTLGTSHIKE